MGLASAVCRPTVCACLCVQSVHVVGGVSAASRSASVITAPAVIPSLASVSVCQAGSDAPAAKVSIHNTQTD